MDFLIMLSAIVIAGAAVVSLGAALLTWPERIIVAICHWIRPPPR